jgi:hypothetical protein
MASRGQDEIHIPGANRGLRHAEILRYGSILGDDPAALVLDNLHSECPVTVATREDDSDGSPESIGQAT